MFRSQAFEYTQGAKKMYLALTTAHELLPYITVDAWSESNPKGYQRTQKMKRSKRFADFLSKFNGIFHQTVLMNVRNSTDIKFDPKKNVIEVSGPSKLYIVDGQHRLYGLKLLLDNPEFTAKFAEFQIPVLITSGLEKGHEALQFFIINSTQAGVKADLKDRLIADVIGPLIDDNFLSLVIGSKEKRDKIKESIDICKELSSNEQSVWKGRIVPPEQKASSSYAISERSFTQAIRQILENDIVSATFQKFPDDLFDPIIDYWNAIRELCPEGTGDDFKKYEILKTKGAFVLNAIFPTVLLYCRGTHLQDKMKEILSNIDELNDADWLREGEVGKKGTSKKVFSEIIAGFVKQLKEAYS